ncbi:cilia- and flagella-associated protein 157-like isoform X2 [Lycorma delicatula]|uniref:cilia- and flagella-associated protein 157-like isoform X2 n=1 Tax=Lycorma delicatula TaxID=130591 RepID=UPI003F51613A
MNGLIALKMVGFLSVMNSNKVGLPLRRPTTILKWLNKRFLVIYELQSMTLQARETEKAMFTEKIRNMENDFKVMHEQLTSEIKLLHGKLNSLEEFRSQREELMNKFLTQEAQMAEQEERHKQTLYEVERKFIIAKDELKKDMENKLLKLSLDFQKATQMRIAATTQRVIRENVAVNNELASLMDSWRELTDEVGALKEKSNIMRLEIDLHKDEKLQCLKRNEIQTRVIDKIAVEHEKLISRYTAMCHYENRSQTLESQLITLKEELAKHEEKLQKTLQYLHYSECERNEHKLRYIEALQDNARLEAVLTAATKIIKDCAILEEKGDDEPSEITSNHSEVLLATTQRESLLNTLLDLFNAVEFKKTSEDIKSLKSIDTILISSSNLPNIYNTGDLGIIPKKSK